MSLFQCDNCGCVENTSVAAQSVPEVYAKFYDWTGIEEKKVMKLCSACGPEKYADGERTEYGKWHGRFARTFLPKGMFRTARNGNLEHIETGDQDYHKWALMLPCPFCGMVVDRDNGDTLYPSGIYWRQEGDMIRYIRHLERKEGDQPVWGVHCPETAGGCGAEIEANTKPEVIAAWNRRTSI